MNTYQKIENAVVKSSIDLGNTIEKSSKDFWSRLNGNKSWILLSAGTILQQAVQYKLIPDSKGIQFSIGVCIALGSLAVGHHIKKGSFSKNSK